MALHVDLYWSFRSPYSYLVTPRVIDFVREYDVNLALKIVYPLAVRVPDYYSTLPPQRRAYFLLDPVRVGQFIGVPYAPPKPDPLVIDPQTRRPAADQPHIRRLSHLGIEANRRGKGLPFVAEVGRIIWSGEVPNWNLGSHLADATARAGLNLAELDRAIAGDAASREEELAGNWKKLEAVHWGVPTFVFNGEPFFGQDRFDLLLWRLNQNGLKRKEGA